jgi:hypothetical protein
MPLGMFINAVMAILKKDPTPPEICVENVKALRFAGASGRYDAIFQGLNAAMADVH